MSMLSPYAPQNLLTAFSNLYGGNATGINPYSFGGGMGTGTSGQYIFPGGMNTSNPAAGAGMLGGLGTQYGFNAAPPQQLQAPSYMMPTFTPDGTGAATTPTPTASAPSSQTDQLAALLAQLQTTPGNMGAQQGAMPPGLGGSTPAPSSPAPAAPTAPAQPQQGTTWHAVGTPGNWTFMNQASGTMGTPQQSDMIMLPGGGSAAYSNFLVTPGLGYNNASPTGPSGEGQGGGGNR